MGTIKRKLERNQYETAAQCAADVRLVWKNCMLYNAERSDFWLLAKSLSKKFEDRYRRVKKAFYVGEEINNDESEEDEDDSDDEEGDEDDDDDDEGDFDDDNTSNKNGGGTKSRSSAASAGSLQMTLDAKARLASNLLILNGPELGHIVTTIMLKSPSSLATNESKAGVRDKMEILIDDLNPQLFEQISKYAADKANARKRSMAFNSSNGNAAAGGGGAGAISNNHGDNSGGANAGEVPAINDISNKRRRK